MCNCGTNETTSFVMKLDTTWEDMAVLFPYVITTDTIKIDFVEYGTNTVIKSISTAGVFPNSRIARDPVLNKIYPIISATDTALFNPAKLYVFDIALTATDGTIRRVGNFQLRSEAVITDVP